MRLEQDAQFRVQMARYALRFTCEHCALWDEQRDLCAHGFPTEQHRDACYEDAKAPLLFCKDFEML